MTEKNTDFLSLLQSNIKCFIRVVFWFFFFNFSVQANMIKFIEDVQENQVKLLKEGEFYFQSFG